MSAKVHPTPPPLPPAHALHQALDLAAEVVVGKRRQIELAVACLLARGHLLIEDQPGVGKTTLAHLLARVTGLTFNRIQFTADMLPADLLGVTLFDRDEHRFEFRPGPVFTQVVLADEINRAIPKTQSALLEVMEERQVSMEGQTHPLPEPFFVIATQNPESHVGTFPLPESQLDRFLMRIEIGYPDAEAERILLRGGDRREMIDALTPALTAGQLLQLQKEVQGVHVSDALLDYLQALGHFSRQDGRFLHGLSPRALLGLLRAAQAMALLNERDAVMPEDVQAVLPAVCDHRLRLASGEEGAAAEMLLHSVAIP